MVVLTAARLLLTTTLSSTSNLGRLVFGDFEGLNLATVNGLIHGLGQDPIPLHQVDGDEVERKVFRVVPSKSRNLALTLQLT